MFSSRQGQDMNCESMYVGSEPSELGDWKTQMFCEGSSGLMDIGSVATPPRFPQSSVPPCDDDGEFTVHR